MTATIPDDHIVHFAVDIKKTDSLNDLAELLKPIVARVEIRVRGALHAQGDGSPP